jgi:hypothetical protein
LLHNVLCKFYLWSLLQWCCTTIICGLASCSWQNICTIHVDIDSNCFRWCVIDCFCCSCLLCSGLTRCTWQGCIRKGSLDLPQWWCQILLQIYAFTTTYDIVVIWEMAIEPTAFGKMVIVWQMLYTQIPLFYLMILNYRKWVLPTKVICFLFCKELPKVSCLHSLVILSGFAFISCVTGIGKPSYFDHGWFRSQDPYLLWG